jgi:hypothetical protein
VLLSDGKETVPTNPGNPKGCYTAARTANDQGVPISTISFGTPYGYVEINGQRQPVPVDDEMLKKIAELSGGQAFNAYSLVELKNVYASAAGRLRDHPRRRHCRLAAARRADAGRRGAGRYADQPPATHLSGTLGALRPSKTATIGPKTVDTKR